MARSNDEIISEYIDLGAMDRMDFAQFQRLWEELNDNLMDCEEQKRREVLSVLAVFAQAEWFEGVERRAQARLSTMTDLTPLVENAPPAEPASLEGLGAELVRLGFDFDSEPGENWIRGFNAERKFVLIYRWLSLALTSSDEAAAVLPAAMTVVKVAGYESEELSMARSALALLDWRASLFPEDPGGIDLAMFSAHDLYFATVV